MKRLLILLAIALATNSYSQNCSRFYPFTEGAKFEVTNYDKRDRVSAVTKNTVQTITSTGEAKTAIISAKVEDGRGRKLTDTTYKLLCDGSQIEVDFHSLLNPAMFARMGNVEMDISGTNVVLPNDLHEGQTLPNAQMDMKMTMAGMNMNISVKITNRKVVGTESVTTSAGTYSCYAITYNLISTTMGVNYTGTGKQWISEGVGLVKQVDYDDSGNINSSSKLTAFSR